MTAHAKQIPTSLSLRQIAGWEIPSLLRPDEPSPSFPRCNGARSGTYAALHLQHGTDVYYVSQQLGHASIELTSAPTGRG